VGEVKTCFEDGRRQLMEALAWAKELTAVPTDIRNDLSAVVSQLKVIGEEVERIR